jgi:hypothetical protein
LSSDQRQTLEVADGPVAVAVARFLDGLELTTRTSAGGGCEALAMKLDAVRVSDAAAAAAAARHLSASWETLRELRGEEADDGWCAAADARAAEGRP